MYWKEKRCSKRIAINIGIGSGKEKKDYLLFISLNNWSDLLCSEDKTSLKENLFLCGRVKEAIFSEGGT